MKQETKIVQYESFIADKIITIRNEKIILDIHLSELYGIETRTLKQAVKRNKDRFPNDFMFELTNEEVEIVVSQNVIPSKKHFGGAIPFGFTENGVAMLSSILKSKKAIEVNITIMRIFTKLRKILFFEKDFIYELSLLKDQIKEHDNNIIAIFEYLREFEQEKQKQLDQENRNPIGYKLP